MPPTFNKIKNKKSSIQMVQTCPVVIWWSENQTKKVCFMVKNVHFSNGPPNRMIRPFKNQTKMSDKSNVWISRFWYLDGYCSAQV